MQHFTLHIVIMKLNAQYNNKNTFDLGGRLSRHPRYIKMRHKNSKSNCTVA